MPEFGSDRMWGLKELPLPEPVSWMPATPGWIVVGVVLLAVVAAILAWRRRARARERYRREAIARLSAMRGDAAALRELPLLLRATALAAFPRDEVAGLRGASWVEWLNEHGGRFEPADAERLDRLPYEPAAAEALPPDAAAHQLDASRRFVRGHRARL